MGLCAGFSLAFILAVVVQLVSAVNREDGNTGKDAESGVVQEAQTHASTAASRGRGTGTSSGSGKPANGNSSGKTQDKGMTLFSEERDFVSNKRFQVIRVTASGNALANELMRDIDVPVPTDLKVMFLEEGENSYYDGQIIRIPAGKCIKQIGVYRNYMEGTVPVVAIRGK